MTRASAQNGNGVIQTVIAYIIRLHYLAFKIQQQHKETAACQSSRIDGYEKWPQPRA